MCMSEAFFNLQIHDTTNISTSLLTQWVTCAWGPFCPLLGRAAAASPGGWLEVCVLVSSRHARKAGEWPSSCCRSWSPGSREQRFQELGRALSTHTWLGLPDFFLGMLSAMKTQEVF